MVYAQRRDAQQGAAVNKFEHFFWPEPTGMEWDEEGDFSIENAR